ncbi:hypothetical protein MAXJ12_26588 [Mesorhizobium alhagi CCNWXJ12-2]|uniref:Uncharacterized protein n=1 Tax=Mesorhizobium alhagi CCNWXJ12-2 TaxID=1107882 RepID=H0HYM6_9HYPH|nr:hypothetical protein MAXJ12_26588 [Mesorhizobium alhagi CCNWXJ12-2]
MTVASQMPNRLHQQEHLYMDKSIYEARWILAPAIGLWIFGSFMGNLLS